MAESACLCCYSIELAISTHSVGTMPRACELPRIVSSHIVFITVEDVKEFCYGFHDRILSSSLLGPSTSPFSRARAELPSRFLLYMGIYPSSQMKLIGYSVELRWLTGRM